MSLSDDDEPKLICDSFVEFPLHFDRDVYRMWLSGVSAGEAAGELLRGKSSALTRSSCNRFIEANRSSEVELKALVLCDTSQAFYSFGLAEKLLVHPSMVTGLPQSFVPHPILVQMAEEYYAIDLTVLRDLIGKKFHSSHKTRDLDGLGDRLRIRAVVCRRMYSNLRRVYRNVTQTSKSSQRYIHEHYALSMDLAETYDCLVFLCYHRFDISRKRVEQLNGEHLVQMAKVLMDKWRPKEVVNGGGGRDQYEIDEKLAERLRDLRSLLLSTREHLDNYNSRVMKQFDQHTKLTAEKQARLQSSFNVVLKNLLTIGSRLNQAKEFDDFFIDLNEKVREPLLKVDLNRKEVVVFFRFLVASFDETIGNQEAMDSGELMGAWTRFVEGITDCTMKIYDVKA